MTSRLIPASSGPRGRDLTDVVDAHRIVALDHDLGPELAQVLHEVVGKGVVVVDHHNHWFRSLAAHAQHVNQPLLEALRTHAP